MTSRSRVLFVDQFGTIGGGQRVLLSLLRAAEQEFTDVGILAPPGPLEEAVHTQSGGRIAYHHCEEPKLTHGGKGLADILALFAYAWRFRKHFRLLKAQQVIYVNGLRHLPHMLIFALLSNARVIYHVHLAHSRTERWLIGLASRWPHTFRIVVISAFVAQQLNVGRKIYVIRNGLDHSFARRAFVNRFDSTDWRLAVIGTLRPEKGQDIAIDAVEMRPGITLHLIGKDGNGAESWLAALKARRLPNVIFDGPVENVAGRLDDLKVQFNLVPSRWQEPFGLVAIEGMACSCLTIVSGTGGLAEIAADTGAIVAKNRTELAAALDGLGAMSPEALAMLAHKQFEATQQTYAPERFEREARALLRAAMAAGTPGP
jgi:glycosyltransferase involved in cell wall biosynthesis